MTKIKIEIKWALIFTAMMLLWMVLERIAGLHDDNIEYHYIVTNFVAIPAILVYVFALRDKMKNFYNGRMTYMQGFMSGIMVTIIVTALTPFTQYVTLKVITPDYFTNMIDYSVKNGMSTLQQAQTYFNMKSYMVQSVIFAPIMGIFTTAIVAIFTRGKK